MIRDYTTARRARIAMRLALAAFLICLARLAWLAPAGLDTLRRDIDTQALGVRLQINSSIRAAVDSTLHELVGEIRQTRKELLKEIRATRTDAVSLVDRRMDLLESKAIRQLELTRNTLADQGYQLTLVTDRNLGRANDSLERIAAIAPPIQALAEQANTTAPLFLDCDHNADCLFNRYVGTARGIEQASLAIGKHAEGQAAAVERISENTARLTDRFAKPTTWWKAIALAPLKWLRIDLRR